MARGGYRDGAELANIGWEPTFPANRVRPWLGIPLPAVLPIDHVLATSSVRITSCRVGAAIGSDHFPLIFDISPRED